MVTFSFHGVILRWERTAAGAGSIANASKRSSRESERRLTRFSNADFKWLENVKAERGIWNKPETSIYRTSSEGDKAMEVAQTVNMKKILKERWDNGRGKREEEGDDARTGSMSRI